MILGVNYVPPREEDKPALLGTVLTTVKTMLREHREFNDIALLLSASLNALHLYADGNGTMSRALYILLTNDYTDAIQLQLDLTASEKGRSLINIDPDLIQSDIEDVLDTEVGVKDSNLNPENATYMFSWFKKASPPEFQSDVPEQDRKVFLRLNTIDRKYLFWSVFLLFRDNRDLHMENYIHHFEDHTALMTADLIKDLTPEQFNQIFQNYYGLKKRYVEKLIDSIAHPDKKEYLVNEQGGQTPLKTYFEKEIKARSQIQNNSAER